MRKKAILMPTSIGADTYWYVKSATEFEERSGIAPIMKQECMNCSRGDDCLCELDFEATAKAGNLSLDIGDKYDFHDYCFSPKKDTNNPNWPSKTGNPSGGNRGNNI